MSAPVIIQATAGIRAIDLFIAWANAIDRHGKMAPMIPTSLYRRHRPQTLDEVVGQQHVVRTLRNAIANDKVSHAYLFVGSRGTGKTSIAKILAKSLNCVEGPTVAPCGKCPCCVAIADGTSLDVIEMDAASHNSVDDIRELREKVSFAPATGRWKIYILDEAHMLSNAAWNAFLKTLEEPPPHTIFVLATTEAQKVMPTIVDRCQRFDFRRPSLDQVGEVLKRVVEAEKIDISDEALAMVARAATGSFRDAISILDQLVTYCGTTIARDDVVSLLGVADAEHVFAAGQALVEQSPRAALEAVERLVESGTELAQFMRDLSSHLRHVFVTQVVGKVPETFSVTVDQVERVRSQASQLSQEQVLRTVELLTSAWSAVKDGADARIQLELALIKAARLGKGSGPSSALDSKSETTTDAAAEAADNADAAAEADAPDNAAAAHEAGDAADDLERIREVWPAAVDLLHQREEGALLGALLAEAEPSKLEGQTLAIAYPESSAFLKRKAEAKGIRSRLEDALGEVSGRKLRLQFELDANLKDTKSTGAAKLSEDEVVELIKREFDAVEITEA